MSDAPVMPTDPEVKTWRTLVLFYDHAEAMNDPDAYHIETYSRRARPTHTKETHE